ncbi:MAG TPA: magnesium chelatase, partial [Nitrospirae bacterium]|nr:magnesium chelatase [Nitrospirota bacterium]
MEFHNNRTQTEDYLYPFSAIMGQEEMKLALILNAIEPRIGGVLIRGEKGTAKSTAVRALRRLLPEIRVVRGCSCLCDPDSPLRACPQCEAKIKEGIYPESGYIKVPLVTLPLNATEEMVTGSLDIEFALRKGQRCFQPGLLARVNRGILYIDEVNLLDDHLVDIILDAVSSGINIVEREGLSYLHPSRFILAGTMNPEEGALRPQLLDRFGLCVEISGEGDPESRVRLMEMRDSYDTNPVEFAARYLKEDKGIAERIRSARERLKGVIFPQRLLGLVSEICLQNNVAGHRADMAIKYAARALAAYEGRSAVTVGDINRVAGMAILHRKRDALPPPPPSPGPVDPDKHEDPGDSDEQKEQGQNSSPDNNDVNNQPRENGEDPDGESDGREEEDYQQG